MFSRVRIKDAGDSFLTPGEVIERAKFIEENLKLKKENKKPAKARSDFTRHFPGGFKYRFFLIGCFFPGNFPGVD